MSTFISVNDQLLARRIAAACQRVVFVAPAVSKSIASALIECFGKTGVSITIVLDPDDEPYRIGYGDHEGLIQLQNLAKDNGWTLRSQPGMRIGLLLADQDILIWSPTPKSVEGQPNSGEPNGIELSRKPSSDGSYSDAAIEPSEPSPGSLAEIIQNAVGFNDNNPHSEPPEIGRAPLTEKQMASAIKVLNENPPIPFDLARKTRVFSSKFQFVEHELRGAEWTKREIKLSTLLLNPDMPEELQDLFEMRVKPFSNQKDLAIDVPMIVQGQVAFSREGQEILGPMTQAGIEKSWKEILDRYLKRLPGFGNLIRRVDKDNFQQEVKAFETVLKKWVEGFRKAALSDEKQFIDQIVSLIKSRAEQPRAKAKLKDIDIEETLRSGIQKLRIMDPGVKLVFKDIAWESTRDSEFITAIRGALLPEDLQGWFETFTAARQRDT